MSDERLRAPLWHAGFRARCGGRRAAGPRTLDALREADRVRHHVIARITLQRRPAVVDVDVLVARLQPPVGGKAVCHVHVELGVDTVVGESGAINSAREALPACDSQRVHRARQFCA